MGENVGFENLYVQKSIPPLKDDCSFQFKQVNINNPF